MDEPEVWALAATQHWLVTRAQLASLGIQRGLIALWLHHRRLWLVYPGVYAVGHPGMTPERDRLAAVLACGEGAGLSNASAAVHWEVWEGPSPDRHHVSIPTRSGRPGARQHGPSVDHRIQIHRPLRLDVTTHRGVPVTTLPQTFVDLATTLRPPRLRQVLRQAERVHGFDLASLVAIVAEAPPTSWRHTRIRRALEGLIVTERLTESDREELYLRICRDHGIPLPTPQVWIAPHRRADFCWPELQLVAEVDDRSSHDGYVAFLDDRRRDREALALGFEVIRFTVAECRTDPRTVARDTKAAVRRRARAGSSTP